MRYLLLLWLITLGAMANMELYPSKECGLFNNLKHTKNRGDEVLKLDRTYEMIKHHKGQYLLKVEYATPAQRWVDDNCLTLRPLIDSPLHPLNQSKADKEPQAKKLQTKKIQAKKPQVEKPQLPKVVKLDTKKEMTSQQTSTHNLLVVSWHNAFCETHRYKKECKRAKPPFAKRRYSDKHFVLHGLWPQPRDNQYCGVKGKLKSLDKHKQWHKLPNLALSSEVREDLERVMPGMRSNLHKHEWVKHGTCYGADANTYYQDSIALLEQLNSSKVGDFFSKNIGKRVTLQQVRSLFNRSFGKGTGKRVQMQCKKGMITELWLHLGANSDDLGELLKKGKPTRSRCFSGLIDKAGFGR